MTTINLAQAIETPSQSQITETKLSAPIHELSHLWEDKYIGVFGSAPTCGFTELKRAEQAKIISALNKELKERDKSEALALKKAEALAQAEKATSQEEMESMRAKKAVEGKKINDSINDEIAEAVKKYNAIYAQVTTNGKSYICRESTNQLGNKSFEMFKINDFKEHCLNAKKIPVDVDAKGNLKYKRESDVWLEHGDKKFFQHGITFYPSAEREIKGKLNRYFGLGVEPVAIKKGNEPELKIYLEHVKKIICANNNEHYQYVIKWLAHMVQKPYEKPEVALILKAGQGTGKGSFVDPIGLMIGSHFVHPQTAEHVVGRFNALMECSILVFADEFFAGHKSATDKLKGMITEKTTTIERKGIDTIEVPSFSRIIMASNHDFIVSIEKDERRYLFLEVDESVKQNKAHFAPLHNAIGGTEKGKRAFAGKLLAYLQSVNIEGWHPREVPKTDALQNAKLDGLDALDSWMHSCLNRGMFGVESLPEDEKHAFEARIGTNKIVENLEEWERISKRQVFGSKSHKVGRLITKLGAVKKDKGSGHSDRMYYELPPLEAMRKNFEEYLGFPIDW